MFFESENFVWLVTATEYPLDDPVNTRRFQSIHHAFAMLDFKVFFGTARSPIICAFDARFLRVKDG